MISFLVRSQGIGKEGIPRLLVCAMRLSPSPSDRDFFRLSGRKLVKGLLATNFLGETPLLHAANAPEPGAFVAVADMLPEEEVCVYTEG